MDNISTGMITIPIQLLFSIQCQLVRIASVCSLNVVSYNNNKVEHSHMKW